nr:hypothetical protein [Pseudomonas syringae]
MQVARQSSLVLSGDLVSYRPAAKRARLGPLSGEAALFLKPSFDDVSAVFCFPFLQSSIVPIKSFALFPAYQLAFNVRHFRFNCLNRQHLYLTDFS